DGAPHDPAQECFPPSFASGSLTAAHHAAGYAEPLAIDVRAYGRHDTLLKVAAGLLNVEYDLLKRRDRQRALRRPLLVFAGPFALLTAYGVSLFFQTRTVNLQTSAILAALARQSSDEQDHGRALRYAVLSARGSLLSPVAPNAEPTLIRAFHFST